MADARELGKQPSSTENRILFPCSSSLGSSCCKPMKPNDMPSLKTLGRTDYKTRLLSKRCSFFAGTALPPLKESRLHWNRRSCAPAAGSAGPRPLLRPQVLAALGCIWELELLVNIPLNTSTVEYAFVTEDDFFHKIDAQTPSVDHDLPRIRVERALRPRSRARSAAALEVIVPVKAWDFC